jgi:hypothetical protein
MARCQIIRTIRTGKQCENEAITSNIVGHDVCASCLAESDKLVSMIRDLAQKIGQPDPYPKFDKARN